MNKTTIDLTILGNQPEALAKITEALAKVYYDNALKRGFDIEPFDEAYAIAFKLYPNYRLILLENPPKFEKYRHLEKVKNLAEITSLPYHYPNEE